MKSILNNLVLVLLLSAQQVQANQCLTNWDQTKEKVSAIQRVLECRESSNFLKCQTMLGLTAMALTTAVATKAGKDAISKFRNPNITFCDIKGAKSSIFINAAQASSCIRADLKVRYLTEQAAVSGKKEIEDLIEKQEKAIKEIEDQKKKIANSASQYYEQKRDAVYNDIKAFESKWPQTAQIDKLDQQARDLFVQAQAAEKQGDAVKAKAIRAQRVEVMQASDALQKKMRAHPEHRAITQRFQELTDQYIKAIDGKMSIPKEVLDSFDDATTKAQNNLSSLKRKKMDYEYIRQRVNMASEVQIRELQQKLATIGGVSDQQILKIRHAINVEELNRYQNLPRGVFPNYTSHRLRIPKAKLIKGVGFGLLGVVAEVAMADNLTDAVAGITMSGTVDEGCTSSDVNTHLDQKLVSGSCTWDFAINDSNAPFFFEEEERMKELLKYQPEYCQFINSAHDELYGKPKNVQCGNITQLTFQNDNWNYKIHKSKGPIETIEMRSGIYDYIIKINDKGEVEKVLLKGMYGSKDQDLQDPKGLGDPQTKKFLYEKVRKQLYQVQHKLIETQSCCHQQEPRPTDKECQALGVKLANSETKSEAPSSKPHSPKVKGLNN